MDSIQYVLDLFLHIDRHLNDIIQSYGALTYGLLFLVVLCETGLVVTPFLPGDSLLFAAGAFAGKGSLNVASLLLLLSIAAVLGDALNFKIGRYLGKRVYGWNSRWVKHEHLEMTRAFFERHGGKTIVIARFMPIVRTYAPFVAGVGEMPSAQFFSYNVVGGLLWVFSLVGAGYFFGALPFVEKNFSLVILAIIVVSVLPGVVGWIRSRMQKPVEAS